MAENLISPRIPPELEREIFQTASKDLLADNCSAAHLALVARRVQTWVEPLIYEQVTLMNDRIAKQFHQAITSKPAAFFKHVKRFCLTKSVSIHFARNVLEVCTEVFDLYIVRGSIDDQLSLLIARLPLLRLSIDFPSVNQLLDWAKNSFSQSHYRNVTHLHLSGSWPSWDDEYPVGSCSELCSLTHLSMEYDPWYMENPPLDPFLEGFDRIKVFMIIILSLSIMGPDLQDYLEQEALNDPRIVVVGEFDRRLDWEKYGRGKQDLWEVAESIIEKRAEKEDTPPEEYIFGPYFIGQISYAEAYYD